MNNSTQSDNFNNNQHLLWAVKILSMVFMFAIILIVGLIPIRLKAFKSNKVNPSNFHFSQFILAFTTAFSGGLFLSVGILHLLPESNENFEKYWSQNPTQEEGHFPFPYLITVLSFTVILFIEKIATNHKHKHGISDNFSHHSHSQASKHKSDNSEIQFIEQQYYDERIDDLLPQSPKQPMSPKQEIPKDVCCNQVENAAQEEQFKEAISTKLKIARRISYVQTQRKLSGQVADTSHSTIRENVDDWAPFILQIAIGQIKRIHAVFEGLAIGIEQNVSQCMGIALAVAFHKWAEGLTLGLAFRKAGVNTKTSTIMIIIQAVMNPIGIGCGWCLSSKGNLTTGIFQAISAGTFIYIATIEVIVEEFNMERYKILKFGFFLLAIGFVCSIYYIELLTE